MALGPKEMGEAILVTIFGATGFSGQAILTEALKQKHEVTILLHDASKVQIKHKNLTIIEGNVLETTIGRIATYQKQVDSDKTPIILFYFATCHFSLQQKNKRLRSAFSIQC